MTTPLDMDKTEQEILDRFYAFRPTGSWKAIVWYNQVWASTGFDLDTDE